MGKKNNSIRGGNQSIASNGASSSAGLSTGSTAPSSEGASSTMTTPKDRGAVAAKTTIRIEAGSAVVEATGVNSGRPTTITPSTNGPSNQTPHKTTQSTPKSGGNTLTVILSNGNTAASTVKANNGAVARTPEAQSTVSGAKSTTEPKPTISGAKPPANTKPPVSEPKPALSTKTASELKPSPNPEVPVIGPKTFSTELKLPLDPKPATSPSKISVDTERAVSRTKSGSSAGPSVSGAKSSTDTKSASDKPIHAGSNQTTSGKHTSTPTQPTNGQITATNSGSNSRSLQNRGPDSESAELKLLRQRVDLLEDEMRSMKTKLQKITNGQSRLRQPYQSFLEALPNFDRTAAVANLRLFFKRRGDGTRMILPSPQNQLKGPRDFIEGWKNIGNVEEQEHSWVNETDEEDEKEKDQWHDCEQSSELNQEPGQGQGNEATTHRNNKVTTHRNNEVATHQNNEVATHRNKEVVTHQNEVTRQVPTENNTPPKLIAQRKSADRDDIEISDAKIERCFRNLENTVLDLIYECFDISGEPDAKIAKSISIDCKVALPSKPWDELDWGSKSLWFRGLIATIVYEELFEKPFFAFEDEKIELGLVAFETKLMNEYCKGSEAEVIKWRIQTIRITEDLYRRRMQTTDPQITRKLFKRIEKSLAPAFKKHKAIDKILIQLCKEALDCAFLFRNSKVRYSWNQKSKIRKVRGDDIRIQGSQLDGNTTLSGSAEYRIAFIVFGEVIKEYVIVDSGKPTYGEVPILLAAVAVH